MIMTRNVKKINAIKKWMTDSPLGCHPYSYHQQPCLNAPSIRKRHYLNVKTFGKKGSSHCDRRNMLMELPLMCDVGNHSYQLSWQMIHQ